MTLSPVLPTRLAPGGGLGYGVWYGRRGCNTTRNALQSLMDLLLWEQQVFGTDHHTGVQRGNTSQV